MVIVVEVVALLIIVLALPQEFLVVGHLDDQRHIEGVLQPFGEQERHQMPHVHRGGRRPPTCVQVKRLARLNLFAKSVHVTVGEINVSPKPMVQAWHSATADGQAFDAIHQILGDPGRAELVDQLVVIHLPGHLMRGDDHVLLVRLRGGLWHSGRGRRLRGTQHVAEIHTLDLDLHRTVVGLRHGLAARRRTPQLLSCRRRLHVH
mmetsp:Transcript_97263/g.297119  ORF Transcript_97263/g.297119 Transcript_97263/m.297119 type:complete len:205 (-) Transcript_97263:443-1057(-)